MSSARRWSGAPLGSLSVIGVGQIGGSVALAARAAGAITEVERYCVWPGQASSYMVGKITFLRLRDKARMALGKKFDLRAFHDEVLRHGALPLGMLERVVDEWVASSS